MISLMSGEISDNRDAVLCETFTEPVSASTFLEQFLPSNGDRFFFENSGYGIWCVIYNRGGKLFVEIGESAA